MATPAFQYQDPFPLAKDDTKYRLLTREGVSVARFDGKEILKVEPSALERLAREAIREVSFFLRPSHNEQVAKILADPEASQNDKGVALAFLRNAEIAARGELPICQDTGTATIVAKKGQQVWTGAKDEEYLSKGVYATYTAENLRYSQTAPLDMYEEVNTGTNLPAQIDLFATDGAEYKFLFLTKGGGSANKTQLWQETKALLNPAKLEKFLVDKMRHLGTAACPPYHIAVVVGGTSAETCVKTVKLASTRYYDGLPTKGNAHGVAFRDTELEAKLLEAANELGIGAQFGGKYFAHDVRVVRLPRHGASCPVAMAVSCSADRNVKAKINKEGIWIEELDHAPERLIPLEYKKGKHEHGVKVDLNRPMKDDPRRAHEVPGLDAAPPQRHARRGARHRPREVQGAPRPGQGRPRVPEEPSRLLRRPGEDAAREALGLVRPDDGGAHGLVRRPAPGERRVDGDDREGQPQPAGHRRVQEARRVLPRLDRRPRRGARRGEHQEGGVHRLPRARDGGGLEDRGRELPRVHPRRRQGERLLQEARLLKVGGARAGSLRPARPSAPPAAALHPGA